MVTGCTSDIPDQKRAESIRVEADQALARGNITQALHFYADAKRLAEKSAASPSSKVTIAKCQVKLNEINDALAEEELRMGNARLRTGDYAKAEAEFKCGLELARMAGSDVQRFVAALKNAREGPFIAALRSSEAAQAGGRFDEAISTLEEAAMLARRKELDPKSIEVRILTVRRKAAQTALRQGDQLVSTNQGVEARLEYERSHRYLQAAGDDSSHLSKRIGTALALAARTRGAEADGFLRGGHALRAFDAFSSALDYARRAATPTGTIEEGMRQARKLSGAEARKRIQMLRGPLDSPPEGIAIQLEELRRLAQLAGDAGLESEISLVENSPQLRGLFTTLCGGWPPKTAHLAQLYGPDVPRSASSTSYVADNRFNVAVTRSTLTGNVWDTTVEYNGSVAYRVPAMGTLVLSPDGQRSAMLVRSDASPKHTIFLDGKDIGRFDEIGTCRFSPDSKTFAFTAQKGQHVHQVIEGQLSPPFSNLTRVVFSPSGRRWAYLARKTRGRWVMILDGRETVEYPVRPMDAPPHIDDMDDVVVPVVFSADDSKVVYTKPTARKAWQLRQIADGKARPSPPSVSGSSTPAPPASRSTGTRNFPPEVRPSFPRPQRQGSVCWGPPDLEKRATAGGRLPPVCANHDHT
jgi:tetratricopeptide (TPR) repeat protein